MQHNNPDSDERYTRAAPAQGSFTAVRPHSPMTSTTIAPSGHNSTAVYHDHRIVHQPNVLSTIPYEQRMSQYQYTNHQAPRTPPGPTFRQPPFEHPAAQTHSRQGPPCPTEYTVPYAPPIQHAFGEPSYGVAPMQQTPLVYPQPQAELQSPYVAYYSVPGTHHPQHEQPRPVAPQQVQPVLQSEAVMFNVTTRAPQPQSTVYVPLQGQSCYPPQNAPDPPQPVRTVIERSYYHPGPTSNVIVTHQRAPIDRPHFGHHMLMQPGTSSTSLTNPRLLQGRTIRSPAVYPMGNRPQEHVTQDGFPAVHVIAQVPQPPTYPPPLRRGETRTASPVMYSSVQHQGYQHHRFGPPDRDLTNPSVSPIQAAPSVPPQSMLHGTAPTLAPALPPHCVTPHLQTSSFPDYSQGAFHTTTDMYGNTVRIHSAYGSPTTFQYVTPQLALKKKRLQWTPELHAKFEAAINEIGIDSAVPKALLQAMNEPSLTRENVASHLQKYREMIRKKRAEENRESSSQPSRKRSVSTLGGSSSDHDETQDRKNSYVSPQVRSNDTLGESNQNCEVQPAANSEDKRRRLVKNGASQTAEHSVSLADTDEARKRTPSPRMESDMNKLTPSTTPENRNIQNCTRENQRK